ERAIGNVDALAPIEILRLEEDHRVRIANRGDEKPLRIVRIRRDHDLEAGDVSEPRLGALRVERAGAIAASPRRTDDDRDRSAPAPMRRRSVLDDRIEAGRDEISELDLDDGTKALEPGADGEADDAVLAHRRIDHPSPSEALVETGRGLERAAERADVLAEDEDAVVALHLLDQRAVDGLE